MGGSNKADTIENLQALCRQCHVVMGDTKTHYDYLKDIHNKKIDGKS
jgi:5-methylcytosine-specific restriction endonuclease McrA